MEDVEWKKMEDGRCKVEEDEGWKIQKGKKMEDGRMQSGRR